MQLNSVYELKANVRELASSYGFGILAGFLDVSVGVGVTATPKDYRLAVRLRGSGLLYWKFKLQVASLARGEIDLQATGPVRVISGHPGGTTDSTRLRIGSSLGYKNALGGTAGFFAKRGGKLGVVSNNHVIAVEDQGHMGDEIVFPAQNDGNSRRVGTLDGTYPPIQDGKGTKEVDCAFAFLDPDVDPDLSFLGPDGHLKSDLATAAESMKVFKIGRATGRTAGQIKAFDFDKLIVRDYRLHDVPFENQIEIESDENRVFSDDGDSGSLVYNADRRPVGLLFAKTSIGGKHNLGFHYANPIATVMSKLGLARIEV